MRRWPELLEAHSFANTRALARAVVVQSAIETPLERPRHAEAIYSDVGFILLGELLTLVGGATLDDLFTEHVVTPLGLTAHYRPVSARNPGDAPIAPTGRLRPREPAPGQTDDWSDIVPRPSPAGEVDDDNAWAMDGVSGHAGVFATTADVARFGVALLEELGGAQRIAPAQLWERMVAPEPFPPGTTRALGFDTPSRSGSSAGERIGKLLPGAFGHTGFTGTSLWVDRPRDLVVALCTNRTVNGRADTRIQQLRPRFHDAVVEVLGL
jgi:CubicO group peptidase (beta-lactamase class C family)